VSSLPASLALIHLFRRCTLIQESPRFWAFHVAGFERVDSEPSGADKVIHLAVEMAPAAD